MISKAARRYAKALLQTATEKNTLGDIIKDIRLINETLTNSRELKVFLKSPIVKSEDKRQGLSAIFDEHISEETKGLFNLLSEKNRENLLNKICSEFIELYNEHQGIVKINVTAAYEMTENQKNALHKELEKSTGKTVDMNISVDSDLIGGIIVKIGDTVIDGSVKHKIRMLKNQFAVSTAV